MDTYCIEPFADGEFKFFLPMARLIAAEREIDGSVFALFDDLGRNLGAIGDETVLAGPSPAHLKHCHALIRNALIGGGASEVAAKSLVETYCYPARPAIYDAALAMRILRATIYGVEVKKKSNETPDEAESPNESTKGE